MADEAKTKTELQQLQQVAQLIQCDLRCTTDPTLVTELVDAGL